MDSNKIAANSYFGSHYKIIGILIHCMKLLQLFLIHPKLIFIMSKILTQLVANKTEPHSISNHTLSHKNVSILVTTTQHVPHNHATSILIAHHVSQKNSQIHSHSYSNDSHKNLSHIYNDSNAETHQQHHSHTYANDDHANTPPLHLFHP
jgi:hypothetical protein